VPERRRELRVGEIAERASHGVDGRRRDMTARLQFGLERDLQADSDRSGANSLSGVSRKASAATGSRSAPPPLADPSPLPLRDHQGGRNLDQIGHQRDTRRLGNRLAVEARVPTAVPAGPDMRQAQAHTVGQAQPARQPIGRLAIGGLHARGDLTAAG
jgi:hypothetical protein